MNFHSLGWLPLSLSFGLVACGTATKVDQVGVAYAAKPANCEITIYDRAKRPSSGFETVAKIESHIKRNMFFGGKVSLNDDAYKELRERACALGGDSVLIEDTLESSAAEMSHIHVWATVVRTGTRR